MATPHSSRVARVAPASLTGRHPAQLVESCSQFVAGSSVLDLITAGSWFVCGWQAPLSLTLTGMRSLTAVRRASRAKKGRGTSKEAAQRGGRRPMESDGQTASRQGKCSLDVRPAHRTRRRPAFRLVRAYVEPPAVRSVRTSATDLSRHRRQVWQDTSDSTPMLIVRACQRPAWSSPPCSSAANPRRGRRPVRRPPLLGLPAQGPLRSRRRGRVRAPLTPPQDQPDRDPPSHRHADHRTT